MSRSAKKIILLAQVSPPIHGQAVMCSLLDKHLHHDLPDYHCINAAYATDRSQLATFSFEKLLRMVYFLGILVSKLITRKRCIVILTPSFLRTSFVKDSFSIWIAKLMGAEIIAWIHMDPARIDLENAQNWFQRWLGITLNRVDLFVSCGESLSEKWPAWIRCHPTIAIPNGVTDAFGEIPQPIIERTRVRVLYLSSLTAAKGWYDLVAAVKVLLDERTDVEFVFVGDHGPDETEESVRKTILSLGEGRVSWLGDLRGAEKDDQFRDADLFVMPSWTEQFPLVVIEALSAGLPIIATDVGGIRGALDDPEGGLLINAKSPAELAVALRKMVDLSVEERHQMGIYNRRKYEEQFTVARFFAGWDRCLTKDLLPSDRFYRREGLGTALKPASLAPPVTGHRHSSDSLSETPKHQATESPTFHLSVYLADQNPGFDRSFGISRMSQVVLKTLQNSGNVDIEAITSKTSQQIPSNVGSSRLLPWGTRGKLTRFLTDHLHPLITQNRHDFDIHYFPKGYLPLLSACCRPSVVTIHDTIVQYDEDYYPKWRNGWEYRYWAMMLKHTLRNANMILTVSESSKRQIKDFMIRHRIPEKNIIVTSEPCAYEHVPQPIEPIKENFVIHLASVEPHKRTAHLIRWWHEAGVKGRKLPRLYLIGSVPDEVADLLASSSSLVKRPFLEDASLQAAYREARALILTSEIEGFGLPALEAYYLGTPVCFVKGTSVEEILGVATVKGGFSLDSADSLFHALEEVTAMSPEEVRECGLKLRETYAAEKVAARMMTAFRNVAVR